MSTITAILEPDADGTLHLPVPPELRGMKVKVEATIEPVEAGATTDEEEAEPVPHATPEMIRRRMEAFDALQKMGGLKDFIPDPVAWQREIREDRALPGRD